MNDLPSPKDPLFDRVEEWRAEFDEDWFVRFARCIILGMIGAVIVLIAAVVLR